MSRWRVLPLVFCLGAGCFCRSSNSGKLQDAPGRIQEPLSDPTEFAPGCVHPAVTESCADGWCRIPAGCFLQGSPEDESYRAMFGEKLTAVTMTRPFLIQQHEVTQAEWMRFAGGRTGITIDPSSGISLDNCLEDDCPAGAVNLVEAMFYANYLSLNNTPPLAPCFKLVNCRGPVSTVLSYPLGNDADQERMACAGFELEAASIYDCEGYRLPTEAEWEYAARAGSRTAYYSGGNTKNPDPLERTSYDDKNLSPIAWYDWNSGNRTHGVMMKSANAWGLYDVLGNIAELTYSSWGNEDFSSAVSDPVRPPGPSKSVVARGDSANGVPAMLRVANRFPSEPNGLGIGFRLVRTLRQGEVWPPTGRH